MYNKLFTKILDSSIWLAPDPHRLVWITLIAAMDEQGNVMFASTGNLAARARVTREQADAAVASFEGPDPDSADPDNDGRRIERFPGGWHVLNAHKYRALVTKAIIQEQTRARVAKHRAKMAGVLITDAPVTHEKRDGNASVTPSVSIAVAGSTADKDISTAAQSHPAKPRKRGSAGGVGFDLLWAQYPKKQAKAAAIKAFDKLAPSAELLDDLLQAVAKQRAWPQWTREGGQFVPMLATWINNRRWEDELARHGHDTSETPRQRAARARVAEMTGGLMGSEPYQPKESDHEMGGSSVHAPIDALR